MLGMSIDVIFHMDIRYDLIDIESSYRFRKYLKAEDLIKLSKTLYFTIVSKINCRTQIYIAM
jgi:hypothetical protein